MAAFVEASNAGNVPVIPAPPLEANLVGTAWQWLSLTKPAGLMAVNDPSRYTIAFNADGTANIKADCNNVGATYTLEGSNINISLGPTTLAACPEDSLDQQFLVDLENARIYFFEGGDLFMDLMADAGTMRFTTVRQPRHLSPPPHPIQTRSPAAQMAFSSSLFPMDRPAPSSLSCKARRSRPHFPTQKWRVRPGCNNYTGALTAVNDYFTVGPIVTTQQACSDRVGSWNKSKHI